MKTYDKYIVYFSGGKDSLAMLLHLLFDHFIPAHKIELWHHDIDGREGETFMDWECTPAYCKAIADHFGVGISFSWKEGGFKGEMLREESLTKPTKFEDNKGNVFVVGGTRGKKSTRLKFPQVTADLKTRWCSAYLKIDVGATAIRNQRRFDGLSVAAFSGERAQESANRAKYAEIEADRADGRTNKKARRLVDRIRIVKNWTEEQVWDIIRKHKVRVHPCYYMRWSRCSCKFCIFGNADQMASAALVSPKIADEIIGYEEMFQTTIKRGKSMRQLISEGTPYKEITPELIATATSKEYNLPVIMEEWTLPAGAFAEGCGPT